MNATSRLLEQRSVGHVHLRMERDGIAVMREAGSAKCRIPRGSNEAILINTSGGLAGGDVVDIRAELGLGAALTITSQAAERVYRTLGPAASVSVSLKAAPGSALFWMPRETILFEGSALSRKLDIELADDATLVAVESMMFGRTEMGEVVRQVSVEDQWRVRRAGKLVHAEAFRMGPDWSATSATLAENRVTATLLMVSPQAELLLGALREVLSPQDGASALNGKLVVRFLAKDGFHLRKTLIRALCVCLGRERLPKCWTF
ncbi:MAG: urease accessory protein UreD [Aestuariivirga sp.]